MASLSFLIVAWHVMHFAVSGMVAKSPGSGTGWQFLQAMPALMWARWLKGIGCTGGGGEYFAGGFGS